MPEELAGLAALAENEELLFLAMLTAEGVKPLSRWEGPVTPRQWQALPRLGLQVAAVHRPTEWGHSVTHVIFSRDRASTLSLRLPEGYSSRNFCQASGVSSLSAQFQRNSRRSSVAFSKCGLPGNLARKVS